MIRVKNNFKPNIAKSKIRAAIGAYAQTAAKKMEYEAKRDAPWTDRTSNARNSIQGNFDWDNNKAKIVLSGNMDYSVYLELAHEEKYAILFPTIQKNAPEVLRGYQKLVKD